MRTKWFAFFWYTITGLHSLLRNLPPCAGSLQPAGAAPYLAVHRTARLNSRAVSGSNPCNIHVYQRKETSHSTSLFCWYTITGSNRGHPD